jgi:hypothetical protein
VSRVGYADKAERDRELDLDREFRRGPESDREKAHELALSAASCAFSDVACHGYRRSPHLRRETGALVHREAFRHGVNGNRE